MGGGPWGCAIFVGLVLFFMVLTGTLWDLLGWLWSQMPWWLQVVVVLLGVMSFVAGVADGVRTLRESQKED